MSRTIFVTSGAVEYLWADVQELSQQDLSSDVVQISLGTAQGAGTWSTPDVVQFPTVGAARVGVLIGQTITPVAGSYTVWVQFGDSPETVPVSCGQVTIK